jgi:hypothetical protein
MSARPESRRDSQQLRGAALLPVAAKALAL